MSSSSSNHPFVIWAACFLWLTSVFDIAWSLLLFFSVGDILLLTGTDLVNALVLLAGVIMLPTNVHMLYAISNSKKISHKTKVVCCPLWLCTVWIIFINLIGIVLCVHRIYSCQDFTSKSFYKSMTGYKSSPKYKHLIDDVQWSLKCCGLVSYKDWFNKDWFDGQDYEMSLINKKHGTRQIIDSVPLSCCKTGSCMPHYLLELGPSSINTSGCGELLSHIVVISMVAHMIIFFTVIIVEILMLKFIISNKDKSKGCRQQNVKVRQIMTVNDKFVTSGSSQLEAEDSECYEP